MPAYYKDFRTSLGKGGDSVIYPIVSHSAISHKEGDLRLHGSFNTNYCDH